MCAVSWCRFVCFLFSFWCYSLFCPDAGGSLLVLRSNTQDVGLVFSSEVQPKVLPAGRAGLDKRRSHPGGHLFVFNKQHDRHAAVHYPQRTAGPGRDRGMNILQYPALMKGHVTSDDLKQREEEEKEKEKRKRRQI